MAVQRGVVQPPNETTKHGNLEHSSGSLSSQAPWDQAPNNANKTSRVNSSGPMGRGGSPVHPPDARHRFNVGDADMAWGDAVVSPGRGDVPVEAPVKLTPGTTGGSGPLRDTAKRGR